MVELGWSNLCVERGRTSVQPSPHPRLRPHPASQVQASQVSDVIRLLHDALATTNSDTLHRADHHDKSYKAEKSKNRRHSVVMTVPKQTGKG